MDLSPGERRKAFENYMMLITARISGGAGGDGGRSDTSYEDLQRAEDEKKQQEKEREELRREREERARRTTQNSDEAARQRSDNHHSRRSATATGFGAGSPQPLTQPKQSPSLGIVITVFASLCIFIWYISKDHASIASAPNPEPPKMLLAPQLETSKTIATTHSVAAINANFRAEPTAQSRIKATLKRGDSFALISNRDNFLEIQLPTGEIGFIAQELVIPSADLDRLLKFTARDYVDLRLPEKRVEALILQTDRQKSEFIAVLFGLTNRSDSIDKYLEELQATKTFTIEPDRPASFWFALAASTTMKTGDYESAYWEARAAVEADPTNAEHHVAFGLANYQLKQYEAVKAIGKILPRLAPTSTNAWMVFGLGNSIQSDSDDELTKSAFVLAIKLSRNANNTRRYFREFAANTPLARTRELLNAALAQEAENPTQFIAASALRTPLKN